MSSSVNTYTVDGLRSAVQVVAAAPSPLRVAIVGAEPLFVDAITPKLRALGMVVIDQDGTATREGGSGRPDIVLVDPDTGYGEAVGDPSGGWPEPKRVLMSGRLDPASVRIAVQQGYRAAISKDIPLERFESAMLSVIQGDIVIEVNTAHHVRPVVDRTENAQVVAASLTLREKEILTLLVEGAAGREIARRLSVSPHTVRTHIQNVMTKLQVHSRIEAVAYAVRNRIVRAKDEGPGELE